MLHLMALRVTPASRSGLLGSQGPPQCLSFGSHRGGAGQPLVGGTRREHRSGEEWGYWPEARAQSGKVALSLAPLPCPSLLFAISHDHGEGMKTDSGSG